jgi:hypothetical protein
MCELLAKIYAEEGWVRKSGESKTARAKTLYDIKMNPRANRLTATKKEPA